MDAWIADFRYSVRSVLKDWRFAALIALTLAICIGANTALFTIVNSVLLRPLPVPDADSILLMSSAYPKAGVGDTNFSAAGDYYDRLKGVTAFQDQAMFNLSPRTIDDNGAPARITGMSATPSLFRLLRAEPAVGRVFTDAEGETGNEQKVILSYSLWQKLFAGDRSAIGRELRLDAWPRTIVGVMPRDFLFVDPEVRFWIPLAFPEQFKQSHHMNNWYNVGRLKPGATIGQVRAQIEAINAANLDRFPQFRISLMNAGFYTNVRPLKEFLVRDVRGALYLLWGGAAFVLLIGAVNIGNLALARATLRMKEFGTRLALGASHARIARQLILENVMIALAGGAAGLAVGASILETLGKIGLDRFPRAGEVRMDATVVAFALTVAALAGAGIALAPLAGIFRIGLATALRESSRGGTTGRRSRYARQSLVVAQIAFAFVLMMGAALLLTSFSRLMNVDPGFKTQGILTASISVPGSRYADTALAGLMDRSLEAIRTIPGVTSAGATTGIPLRGEYYNSVILPEGYAMKPGESIVSPVRLVITPGYMPAMNIALLHGRYFDESDNANSPRVAIVDERLARRFWPGRDPIGRRMYLPTLSSGATNQRTTWITVVGVARDVRLSDLAGNRNSAGTYYYPYRQNPERSYTFAAALNTEPLSAANAMRTRIAAIDPTLALFDVMTMTDRKELSLSGRRTSLSLALGFGGLALFLSAIGIYSVLSYLLGQRRREIGIRLAVGSSQAGILMLFLREALVVIAMGILLGLAGAATLRKAVETQIYGVQPLDPLIIGAVTILLGGIALAACLRPAQRAARLDPVIVLNEQ